MQTIIPSLSQQTKKERYIKMNFSPDDDISKIVRASFQRATQADYSLK